MPWWPRPSIFSLSLSDEKNLLIAIARAEEYDARIRQTQHELAAVQGGQCEVAPKANINSTYDIGLWPNRT